MRTSTLSQTEPPGAPRETPWEVPERRSPETPGEPQETPWPDPVPPASEPPGDPQETPWPEEDAERDDG